MSILKALLYVVIAMATAHASVIFTVVVPLYEGPSGTPITIMGEVKNTSALDITQATYVFSGPILEPFVTGPFSLKAGDSYLGDLFTATMLGAPGFQMASFTPIFTSGATVLSVIPTWGPIFMNIVAAPVPEPAVSALLGLTIALGLALRPKRGA
jgi:hypothetical protein